MDSLNTTLGSVALGDRLKVDRLVQQQQEEHEDEEAPSRLCLSYDNSQSSYDTTGLDADPQLAGAQAPFGTASLWKKSILKVHFTEIPVQDTWRIDDKRITTTMVLKLANEWSSEDRDWCVPKFVLESSKEKSDIRVKFETSGGNRSYIGTTAQGKNPSMWLNLGVDDSNYKKYVVRHEFGHALGLGHEHQGRKAPRGLIIKEAVVDYLMQKRRMTKDDAERCYKCNYEQPPIEDLSSAIDASGFDQKSIMHYWIDPAWINRNHDYARKYPDILQNGINRSLPCTLSDSDKEGIVKLYKGDQAADGDMPDTPSVPPDPATNKPTIDQLIDHVKTTEWRRLGRKLGVDEHNLNVIAKNERLNVEGAREEMLTNWFGSCANPTWRAVVNALKEIKENHLARQLETKFCPAA